MKLQDFWGRKSRVGKVPEERVVAMVMIANGGVLPNVHTMLLPKRNGKVGPTEEV